MYAKILALKDPAQRPEGLSKTALATISKECQQRFGCTLPKDYAEFLKKTNGLIYNGTSVLCYFDDNMRKHFPRYAGSDFFKVNAMLNDVSDYLFLGKSSLEFLVYDHSANKYFIVSNETLDIRVEASSFIEILTCFFDI